MCGNPLPNRHQIKQKRRMQSRYERDTLACTLYCGLYFDEMQLALRPVVVVFCQIIGYLRLPMTYRNSPTPTLRSHARQIATRSCSPHIQYQVQLRAGNQT